MQIQGYKVFTILVTLNVPQVNGFKPFVKLFLIALQIMKATKNYGTYIRLSTMKVIYKNATSLMIDICNIKFLKKCSISILLRIQKYFYVKFTGVKTFSVCIMDSQGIRKFFLGKRTNCCSTILQNVISFKPT